jgi:hypothetical protein
MSFFVRVPGGSERMNSKMLSAVFARPASIDLNDLDLAIELVHRFVQIDVPAMKPPAHDHAALHGPNLASQ